MNTIENLRQKRADTWDQAKAFLDERRGEDGQVGGFECAGRRGSVRGGGRHGVLLGRRG